MCKVHIHPLSGKYIHLLFHNFSVILRKFVAIRRAPLSRKCTKTVFAGVLPQTPLEKLTMLSQRVMNTAARVEGLSDTRNVDRGLKAIYTTSSIGPLLITSSQPLMLLLAAAVYDLPTGTVSLCLTLSTQHLRLSGVQLCWPDNLELVA